MELQESALGSDGQFQKCPFCMEGSVDRTAVPVWDEGGQESLLGFSLRMWTVALISHNGGGCSGGTRSSAGTLAAAMSMRLSQQSLGFSRQALR